MSERKQQSSAEWGQQENDKPAGRSQRERERLTLKAVQSEGSAGQSQKERDWQSLSKRTRAKAAKQCKAVQDEVKGRERARAEEWQIVCLHESMFLKCGRLTQRKEACRSCRRNQRRRRRRLDSQVLKYRKVAWLLFSLLLCLYSHTHTTTYISCTYVYSWLAIWHFGFVIVAIARRQRWRQLRQLSR